MSRQKKKLPKITPKHSLKSRWLSWYGSKSPVLRFGLKFGALMLLLYGLLAMPFFDRLLYSYLEANAWLSNFILNLMGQNTQVSGIIIESPQFAVSIQRGCDAVEPTWLFCAAVLSFPSPWTHKLPGMLAGIILLQTLNLVRIVTLFWLGLHWPAIFNTAHMEIWPTLFIIAAIVLFVGWKDWTSDRQAPHAAA